jgi:hypothetical protein
MALIKNRERLNALALRSRRYRKNHPDKVRRTRRKSDHKYYLKIFYDMTVEEYSLLLRKQKGHCAICGRKPRQLNGRNRHTTGRRLCVDHNHKTKKNRGLLCDVCNRGIGQFKESIRILKAALRYLMKYSGRHHGILRRL